MELGPVAFSELVRLVRADGLSADDLVREEWNQEWRPAAMAVGLFHMAGRQDLIEKWEAERREAEQNKQEAREAELAAANAAQPEEEPAWQRRLREVATQREAERDEQWETASTRIQIDQALEAALEEIEAREKGQAPSRMQRWLGSAASPQTLHALFRWSVTLAIPNLAAAGILRWSEEQAQRFPDPQLLAAGLRPFPAWGPCDPQTYYFLLFDAMLFAGIVSYVAARSVESWTDD
jgi:hypothetical protein